MADAKPEAKKIETAKTTIGRTTASRFPAVFCSFLFVFLSVCNWLGTFELSDRHLIDQMFRWRGPEAADQRVTVIAIDDESIGKIGQYPWPRGAYKKLLDKLFAVGVKVVGMDVMFFEPSPSAAQDQLLIEATRRWGGRVVHAVNNDINVQDHYAFQYPFPALRKATKSFGAVTQPFVEPDGSVRETPTIIGHSLDHQQWDGDPEAVPSMGSKVLSIFEGKPPREYARHGVKLRLNWRGSLPKVVKVFEQGKVHERIDDDHRIAHVSAWRVLQDDLGQVEQENLKGGIALVASTTLGAFDHYPSPFSKTTAGVLVHANLIDNLLHDRFLREASTLHTYPLIALMLVLAMYIVRLPPLWAGVSFLALVGAYFGAAYASFRHLVIIETVAPVMSLVVSFFALIIHKAIETNRKAAEVRQMFGQYVAPEVVEILVKDPSKLRLGGEKRDMTIFFLDIAHFTTISEAMSPENLIQFLNTYLTALTDDILGNNGVVDKYIGDCIMAFWNAPLEEKEHRKKACLAAVACVKTIERLNKEYVDPSIPETPAVRIGLNSGHVVVGNTGSARKLAYTVLGDEVNLASRLEGANKFFGSTLMASEDTFEGGKEVVEGRLLGAVRVVGKNIPIRVYELMAKKGELSANWTKALPVYHAAIAQYEVKKFEEASVGFKKVLELIPGDKTTKLYLSVCEDYAVIPPPEGWEPVFNLTSK